MNFWIDTHCHLDSQEFGSLVPVARAFAAMKNVAHCVYPAVAVNNFDTVRELAHRWGDSYALGIHPLSVRAAQDSDLQTLDQQLSLHRDDPRLVAVGEIGLDYFVPALCESPWRERQEFFYKAQLKLAQKHGLPVILHVRRSADRLLKFLREAARQGHAWSGIAHAFNGSSQQAVEFTKLGFKLGFGGAVTFETARALRRLAVELPLGALVLETDAPDIPPRWLYKTKAQRLAGALQGRNEPGELPRIGAEVAALRGITPDLLAQATTFNAIEALPRLKLLLAALLSPPTSPFLASTPPAAQCL